MDRRKSIQTLILGVGATGIALKGYGAVWPTPDQSEEENYFPDLITATPMEGRELAIKLSRQSIAAVQADPETRKKLRAGYAKDTSQLIASAEIIAREFQNIAQANNYWR